MIRILAITVLMLLQTSGLFAFSSGGFMSLKKAFDQGKIALTLTSLGCYNDACLSMFIVNKTNETLLLEIDAGLLIEPFNPEYQSYLIKERQKIALPTGVEKTLKLDVFSASIKKKVAGIDEYYALTDSTPTLWYQVVNYLAINDYEPLLGQRAVWAVTNQFPVNAVCSANKKETARLRTYLQTIIPVEDTWVNLFFTVDSMGIPTKSLEKIRLDMPYSVRNNTMVSFYIANERGEIIKKLKQNVPRNPGSYQYEVEFSIVNWPVGTYYLMVRSPEQMLLKKPFSLNTF